MKEGIDLDKNSDYFSAKRGDGIITISFDGNVMLFPTLLRAKEAIFDYLDLVSNDESIKVVILKSKRARDQREDYFAFYDALLKSKIDANALIRMFRCYDQLILKIVESSKFFIEVGRGDIILQTFNVGLACDYRIVTNHTVIHNPSIGIGLMSKGGGAYFLKKMLGHTKTYEILLSDKGISSKEALKLGIVDKIVVDEGYEDTVLKIARYFCQKPATSLAGLKKFLNYPLKDLKDYLEFENQELFCILNHFNSHKKIAGGMGWI